MKRNFYLQHPLMAMHDPRMQYLLKMEKLKGTGAYWFVIEKLAMLPGSCVDMEFLRPYCKMHKISFAYVKKIILGYEYTWQNCASHNVYYGSKNLLKNNWPNL